MLLHRYPLSAEAVVKVLNNYLSPSDVQSLHDIYGEIEARIRRYTKRAP